MESFTNSCRLCLWKGDKMIPIFTSPDDDETASKIRKCLPLDVRWEDNLPKGICASCLYKVETLYEFNCSAVRIDSLLRKYLPSEIKDGTIKEQQLNSSDYEVSGMRSVAVGTDDEYVPSARIRECRDSSTDTEPFVGRVRVRTPFDLSDVSSVGTSPMVLLSSDSCSAAVALRSDSVQSAESGSGVAEQAAASRGAYQREDAGQHTPAQGEAMAGTGVVCISVKSSPNVTQNDPSTTDPCKCADDDDVVVLAEIQKPSQPNRRCRTQRLCAQHRQLRMQQEQQLQQQGPPQPGTQSGPDQPPPRAGDRVAAAGASSSGLALSDASTQVRAGRDPSPGAGARHLAPETPSVGTSSYSTEPEGHVHTLAQCRQMCGATSSLAARELSHSAPRPGQPEQECSSAKCNSSVPELLDGASQTTLVHPRGTTVECSQTKSCGNSSSSSEVFPPAAAHARLPPVAPAAPLRAFLATPAVRPPCPAAIPIPSPLSSVVPTPSSNLIRTSAALPNNPVLTSSGGPPGTPATTQSAAPAVGTSSVIQLARSGSTTAHSPSPAMSPSGGQSPSGSQSSSAAQKRSRSRSTSKSPSGGRGRISKSPVSATSARPSAPPTPAPSVPAATRAPPAPASASTPSTWTVSATTATSTKLLRVPAQPQQQETRQQRVLLPACGPGHPEHTVIQANLQNGVYKINRFVYVPNTTFHAQTQAEQQVNVSQVSPATCPGTATAQSLPSATPQTPAVLKEEELKPQLEQNRSSGEAINQLIAASALISPPRVSAEPVRRVKKEVKSPGQLTATHLSTAPQPKQPKRKSQVQCEQQKNRQQVPCDKLPEKISRETAASAVDTGGKGGSAQSRQTVSWADRKLTSSTTGTATSNSVAESSKKKKEHRSHAVIPEMLATPAKDAVASPTSEQPKQIKQKHRTAQSPTDRNLVKSPEGVTPVAKSPTEIAEKMKKTPQVAKSQLPGGTVEEHQSTKPPAFQNSDISQKWKKKKKKKKEKEEEGSHHRSSHKYQHEHKRKHSSRNTRQPADPPPTPEADTGPEPQQIQKTETASTGQPQSQMATTKAKFDLSGGEAEQPQVERWRSVQAAAVERVRSAVRERARPPPPSPPLPSAPTETPPPPVLTPPHPARGPVSPTSPSPTPPTLPPAVSAAPSTDCPPSGALPRPATPPPGERSPTATFLTPPDGADQQKFRSQPTPKTAAEVGDRRLRTPSPAASSSSAEWPSGPCRSACSPRRYYNRKRKHSDLIMCATWGADGAGAPDAGDSAERGPAVPPASEAPPPRASPQPAAARSDWTFAVPSEISVPPPRTGRVFRYTCRHCRQRFGARIHLSLHHVNGACAPRRSHDHDYARDRPAVTERELMAAARVRLERLFACPRCHRVLASSNTLRWHLAVRHGRDHPRDTRATLQARWQDAPPPPVLLPLAGKAADSKDTMLEALGLTRKA